jgi:hypothetical protein
MQRSGGAIGIGDDLSIPLEPAPWEKIEARTGRLALQNLRECVLPLVANYDIYERFSQSFRRYQRGMPSSEYDGQLRLCSPHRLACRDRIANHRPGQDRHTKRDGISGLPDDYL